MRGRIEKGKEKKDERKLSIYLLIYIWKNIMENNIYNFRSNNLEYGLKKYTGSGIFLSDICKW